MATALIPSPALDTSAIDRAPLQPSTKAKYTTEIRKMHAAGVNPANHKALQAYADTLKSSRRQFLKSALRLMVRGIEQDMKAGATPQNLKQTQAALLRLEAMQNAVTVEQHKGTKAHTWLSQKQVVHITSLCGDTLKGKRDWIILGLLLGAGLRRDELVNLTFDALKQQPTKAGKMRTVIEVQGKGNKSRVIPIQDKLADHLREWRTITGGGYIARAMTRSGDLPERMSDKGIFELVRSYGRRIGLDTLAPHDLRRTFAQLGYEAGIPLTQISTLLGHSSVATTQRYLNLALDLETSASDFIPLA